jgi:hypothetical protein
MAFDFSARDYQTIKQDLLLRASATTPEWTDRDPSDFGMVLVDLWAYMGDVLHYYVDRVAQEMFIDTATQRESVLAYANLLDYRPNYRQQATSSVTLANSGDETISISAGTEFVAVNDDVYYYFYTTDGASVGAESTAVVSVVEGEQISEEILTTSSTGNPNQRYFIRSENVAPSSVRVFVYEDAVDPTEWQQVDSLADVDAGVGVFTVYVNANDETLVIFGNRINGRIPPTGVKITASYSTTSGAAGNLPANKITAFRTVTSADLTIQSSTAATGGADNESVSSMKRSVQSITRAQNRAVTLTDFSDLTSRVGGVVKSIAEYNPSTSTVTVYPVPYVSDYTSFTGASVPIPTDMQEEAVATIQPLAMVGVTVVSATKLDVYRVDMSITVKVNDRYVAPWVQRDVETAITNLFTYDNVQIGQEVRIGDVYKTILSIEGVEYAVIGTFVIKDNSNVTVTSLPANVLLRKGTVTLTISGGISTS